MKKDSNLKIRQGRVMVLMHSTSTQWDLFTYKVFVLPLVV